MHERFNTSRGSFAAFVLSVVVLLAAVAAIAVPRAAAITDCSPSSSWGTNRADLASQVVGLINQYRAGKGLAQLAVSQPLTASSVWKSLHMAGYGYFAHDDPAPPVGRSASQRARDCGYGGSWWGENIAWGYTSAQAAVNGWLGSAGHKANIENPSFTSTGVGVAADASGQLYWTQSFGNDVSAGTPAPAPAPPAPTPPPAPAPAPTPTPPPASAPTPAPAPAPAPASPSSPTPAGDASQAGSTTTSTPALGVGAKPAQVLRQPKRSRLVARVVFVHLASGRPMLQGSVRCRAEVDGKRLRVLANAFSARAAKCAWKVPRWAHGKQLTGIVAVQVGDTAARRLFVRTIH